MSNKKNKFEKSILLIIDFLVFALVIFLDKFSKYYVINNLKGKGSLILIDNILQLTYKENAAGILGMIPNQQLFLMFMDFVFTLIVIVFLIMLPSSKKFRIANILLSFIIAGSVANLIDRIKFGYVIDFIYFVGINFPLFNLADLFLFIGALTSLLLLIFYYNELDFVFLKFKSERFRVFK